MQIACDAETFNEKNRAGGSQSATIIAMAKKQAEMQISEYDIRVQQMNQLATNAMGYYETIETQDDGSIICYMHDKENLSDSKTIWKKTVDGIFISSDGGKTYIAGVDKNGNAVLKILATEGIVADWINAGTLNANLIKSGTLNGNTIKADTLSGEDIKTGTLDGDTIKANTLNGIISNRRRKNFCSLFLKFMKSSPFKSNYIIIMFNILKNMLSPSFTKI